MSTAAAPGHRAGETALGSRRPADARRGSTRQGPRTGGWYAREPWRSALVAAPLVIVGLLLVPVFEDGLGLDGLAYVSIAMQYAEGGLPVNGYWGPLWSWLLVPLLLVGIEPLTAASVLQVISSVLVLLAFRRLSTVLGVRPAVRDVLALAITPFLVTIAHYGVFVDVLMSAFLLLWCAEVLSADFATRRVVAVRAGVWAGLATLTKIYALPFVGVHLVVVLALHLYRRRSGPGGRRQVIISGVLSVAVLALIFAPWVAALSQEYDRFTVTKSARYNVTIAGPGSQGNPIRYAGLIAPPGPDAVSVWEDPSALPVDADGWSSSGAESADRLVDNVVTNLGLMFDLVTDEMVLVTVLGLAGAVLALLPQRRGPPWSTSRLAVVGLLAGAAIYGGGYLLLFVERRYIWFLLLLAAVPAGLAVQWFLSRLPRRRRPWALAVTGLVLALAVAAQSVPLLAERSQDGERAQEVASALAAEGGVSERVASDGFWERTAVICLQLDCQYFGEPRDYERGEGLQELLQAWGIGTYLAWGEPLENPPGRDVTPDGLENVYVYEVPSS